METKSHIPRVDFHVHYTDESAKRTIEKAGDQWITAIALIRRTEISDHMPEYINYGEKLGVKVLPGVEFFAGLKDTNVELIALGFDYTNITVRNIFGVAERKDHNKKVAEKQKELFEAQGFYFEGLEGQDKEELTSLLNGNVTEKAILFCRLASRNPANRLKINALKEEHSSLWKEIEEASRTKKAYSEPTLTEAKFLWRLFFMPGKPCFIAVQKRPGEIIDAIHQAGGVVLYSPEGKFNESDWRKLIDLGIDGIMGWHGGKLELGREIVADARKRKLLILGGSDYDPDVEEWQVGSGSGALYMSPRRYQELTSYLAGKK